MRGVGPDRTSERQQEQQGQHEALERGHGMSFSEYTSQHTSGGPNEKATLYPAMMRKGNPLPGTDSSVIG
jgi:hypothetical protein